MKIRAVGAEMFDAGGRTDGRTDLPKRIRKFVTPFVTSVRKKDVSQ